MSQIPIAVLASGRGSNFEAIQRAVQAGELPEAKIVALLSDQPGAPALEKARAIGVKTLVVPAPRPDEAASAEERRRIHDGRVVDALRDVGARWAVMAGYMRIVTPVLIEAFRSERGYTRIVNVHPSLLPAFRGLEGYGQAFRYGAKLAGVSVHLVEVELDSGPICAQEAFSIEDCRSEQEVETRGLAIEHRLYPETLKWVLPEKFNLETRPEGRLCVRPN
jgi:phosphoribosylglycinamide formyltransferase 1